MRAKLVAAKPPHDNPPATGSARHQYIDHLPRLGPRGHLVLPDEGVAVYCRRQGRSTQETVDGASSIGSFSSDWKGSEP